MTLRKIVPAAHTTPKRVNIHTSSFDSIDRLFDNLFHNSITNLRTPSESPSDLNVPINVSETDKHYLLKADLPGLSDKDIDLDLDENILTLSGERSYEDEYTDQTVHRVERRYGSFKRSFTLPNDADLGKIKADMKHGVLTIQVDKLAEEKKKSKRISIKSS